MLSRDIRTVLDGSALPSCLVGTGARVVWANWAMREVPLHLSPEILAEFLDAPTGHSRDIEHPVASGSARWRWSVNRLAGSGEVLLSATDVSDLVPRPSKDSLCFGGGRFDTLLDAVEVGLWSYDLTQRQLHWSPRCKAHHGLPAAADVDLDVFYGLVHPDDREATCRVIAAAQQSGSLLDIEYRILTAAGELRWIRAIGRTFHNSEGCVVSFNGVTVDRTEWKRFDDRTTRSQKMESLGILAGGIAHDFNNLLTGILGSASLLTDDIPPGSPSYAMLQNIIQASERAAQLTRQMLAYSGRGHFALSCLDLSQQFRDFTHPLRASLPKYVRLHLDLGDELPHVDADIPQLQQLVLNLVTNAAEAIGPEGGEVTIATSLVSLPAECSRENLAGDPPRPGDYVLLEVRDTGHGMDTQTTARIFDPFFTTKFLGRGLGLAAVLGIVRGHGACLNVESRPGNGTSVQVLFPRSARQPAVSRKPPHRPALHAAGTVLVVDDEEVVRQIAAAAFQRFGFEVLCVENGREALNVVRRDDISLSLILLDMSMPVMDGAETLRFLRLLKPNVPVIASSGFQEAEAHSRFGPGLAAFVQKPYTTMQLSDQARLALNLGARGNAA